MTQEPNSYKLAKSDYLSEHLEADIPPDLKEIAQRYGLDENLVQKQALSEGWIQLRNIRIQEFQRQVVKFENREIKTQAKDLTSVRINLFNADIELVQTQFQKLVKYIDDKLDAGEVGVKEALTYLKLIMEKSDVIQNIIERKHMEVQNVDANIEKLLSEMGTKTKLLNILEDVPHDPYKEEREALFSEE